MKKLLSLLLVLCLLVSLSCTALASNYTYTEPSKTNKLPRASMAEKGINSDYIFNLLEAYARQNIEVHAIDIAVDGEVVFDSYWAPYDEDTPHIVHSLTKLFANSAVACAISDGLLTLDTRMIDILPEFVSEEGPLENQDKVTVRNLLNMTAGYGRMISGSEWRPLKTSWLEAFFAEPIPYEPGTHYQYSSGNPYATSAMVQKVTGMTAEDYLMSKGFSKLNFANFTWQKSPEGICSGGNGVKCTAEDMLKVGILFLNKGMWNGEQILDPDLCDMMIGISEPITEGQTNYAAHWARSETDPVYYAAGGSYGQSVILVPDLNMVVSILAGTSSDVNEVVFNELIAPTVADRAAGITTYENASEAALEKYTSTLSLMNVPVFTASPMGEIVDDVTFTAEENKYNIEAIALDIADDAVTFTMKDNRGIHTVVNGIDQWLYNETTMTGNYMHHQYTNNPEYIYAYAEWQDDATLTLTWRYPQMAFVDQLTLTLTEDGTGMTLVRTVNVNSGELITEPVALNAVLE